MIVLSDPLQKDIRGLEATDALEIENLQKYAKNVEQVSIFNIDLIIYITVICHCLERLIFLSFTFSYFPACSISIECCEMVTHTVFGEFDTEHIKEVCK